MPVVHRHELGRAVPRWLVVGALCAAVLAAPAASPTAGASGAARPGVAQVDPPPAIDNGIFRVQVDGGATLGSISVTTAADHPSGPDLPVLSQPGRPGSSFFTVHSYDTGTDYTQRPVAGAVNLAPVGIVTPVGADGLRVTYEITEPDTLRIVQDVTIGGTTLDDTFVAVKTTVVNTGGAPARVGLRRLWDLHLLTNARPAVGLDAYPSFDDVPAEQSIARPQGDGWTVDSRFDGLGVAGSIGGATVGGSPRSSRPDLLQSVNWSSGRAAPFRYTVGDSPRALDQDSVLLAYWGDRAADARVIAPGGHTTVTTVLQGHVPPGFGGAGAPRGPPLPIRRRHRSVSAEPAGGPVPLTAPAFAAPDATGDAPYAGGDIIDWSADVVPGSGGQQVVRVRVHTQEGLDPVWSYPWRFGRATSVQGYLDVDGHGADFVVRLWDYQGAVTGSFYGLHADLFRSDGTLRYRAPARPFHDGDATYGFDVPVAFLGDNVVEFGDGAGAAPTPTRVRVWVGMLFQPEPFLRDPPTGTDFAPETGWSPWLDIAAGG